MERSTQEKIVLACTHPNATGETSIRRDDGSVALVCCDCWNKSVYARRDELKAANAARKAAGVAAWAARGVKVGDKLVRYAQHMLVPGPSLKCVGVAKAGRSGAYVAYQGKQYEPDGWAKEPAAA